MIRLVVPEMDSAELNAVREVLDSGYLVQGSNVRRFEELVADYLNIAHVVAVSSGTAALKGMGVECTIGTYACHAQPFFQERYGYRPGDLPNSYLAFQRTLTLPLHSRMSTQDAELVIQALRRAVP
jgi:dTDP-4-amino-4,6-dideoxygalactose transaminase